jgi:hypothetical protein
VGYGSLYLDLLDISLGGITINYYSRNLIVITFKTFTNNHNTQPRCNTLCTVLIPHRVISCNLTCALLAASLIHLLTSWFVLATLTVELNCLRIFPESRYIASAPTAQKTQLYCWLALTAQKTQLLLLLRRVHRGVARNSRYAPLVGSLPGNASSYTLQYLTLVHIMSSYRMVRK